MVNIEPSFYGNYLASMANIPSLTAIIKRPMANIEPAMAEIEISMADITSRYGGNFLGMAKTVLILRKLSRVTQYHSSRAVFER